MYIPYKLKNCPIKLESVSSKGRRLNSDPSKSVILQFKFLLETISSLIGQFLNWYMIYMLNKVHKYLKKSSTNYFLLKIFQTIFLMYGQTILSQVKGLCVFLYAFLTLPKVLTGTKYAVDETTSLFLYRVNYIFKADLPFWYKYDIHPIAFLASYLWYSLLRQTDLSLIYYVHML